MKIRNCLLVLLVILVAGCTVGLSNNLPLTGDTNNQIINRPASSTSLWWVAYTPMQCQETPWQIWFESGQAPKYLTAPTEEQLAQDYLVQVLAVAVIKLEKVRPEGVSFCQACFSCPQGYYLNVQVNKIDRQKLLNNDWQDAIKIKE
ncbi:MAG: hypothetical protein WCW02_00155 [Candidatus Buchananbacteria bacterium]